MSNFNATNRTIDLMVDFEEPFDLGLNTGKSDYLMVFLNASYPWKDTFSSNVAIPAVKAL